ncbi:ferredoxin [Gordonia hydrophobica]|uniref:Ferredoxin n=1 Tax=Gordonia hydrophobica TaxID=40516 RepID=A0ABZ2TZN8_9ACTN|nr:ferredoxin [Gordonia hydrophobica]MBM7368841.1 ferredoxin [Gordonia hydrophobica]
MARIELNGCVGHALCNVAAPDVYDLDDDGYCIPPMFEVADDARKQAMAGVKACPERALTLVDE